MTDSTQPNPSSILKQIAQIQQMERGSISVIRKTAAGSFYNHQTWENGKNKARYVPRDELASLQEAIDGYKEYKELTEEYAQQIIDKTRAERAAHVKKKHLLKSSSPKTPKSSS
jgi:hypothetical protein